MLNKQKDNHHESEKDKDEKMSYKKKKTLWANLDSNGTSAKSTEEEINLCWMATGDITSNFHRVCDEILYEELDDAFNELSLQYIKQKR